MEYQFYGWENAVITNANKITPRDLYDLLLPLWCSETCAPRLRELWSEANPTVGQCSITAFLVQDLFGGKVFGVPRRGGTFHCFNVVGDCVFDLTSEQFCGEKLDYSNCPEQFREVHFAKEEKWQRYLLLRRLFFPEYAVMLKHRGFNCCQAVLSAYDPALKSTGAAFGGGMGCMEATCGSLVGAQILLGINEYRGRPILRDAAVVHNRFKELSGASVCKELKGRETGIVLCECDDCVRNAMRVAEEAIIPHEIREMEPDLR